MAELAPVLAWAALPVLVAVAVALVTGVLVHARMEIVVARQREALAEARALLATQHRAMDERIKATEQEARRKALEEFLLDVRVEERCMLRNRRSLVIQERVSFRNIPLTPWVEREMPGVTELPVVTRTGAPPAAPELSQPPPMSVAKLLP